MIKAKINPVGVDILIQRLQKHLHDRLLVTWGLQSADYVSYARCYRNRRADGYAAEWYEGDGEYKDVYYDDTKAAVSFFGIGNRTKATLGEEVSIHLVFFVNLAKLKPLIAHRADEEVRKDVRDLIGSGLYGCEIDSVEMWLENCLKEYPSTLSSISTTKNGSVIMDTHPAHCFRINLIGRFSKNIC